MKKLPLILSVLSLVGVVALFIITFSAKPQAGSNQNDAAANSNENEGLRIAYVLTDSVLVNYQLSLDLNDQFVKKQQQFNDEFTRKRTTFEQDAVKFQEKVQSGGFLTEERAIRERDRLISQEQEIQQLDSELSAKLAEMEQGIYAEIIDSLVSYVKEYNTDKGYDYIFNNSGNIIVGDTQHNITAEILKGLNSRYEKNKKK